MLFYKCQDQCHNYATDLFMSALYTQIQHLMANYDRSVRPSRNAAEPLNITFGLALTQIIDVVSADCERFFVCLTPPPFLFECQPMMADSCHLIFLFDFSFSFIFFFVFCSLLFPLWLFPSNRIHSVLRL